MVAAHGEVPALRERKNAAFDFTDPAPVDFGGVAVLFVTGDDATFAADALFDVEVKSILFACLGEAIGREQIGAAQEREFSDRHGSPLSRWRE